ncbi:MAG: DEAD/DEAH box helicase [Desulfobacterales bacterium]|nr:DEAD/DEAH box helicase [Desulfobacterales bacterium]
MPEESEAQPTLLRGDAPSFLTETQFEDFSPPEQVLKGLGDAGFTFCSPIQAQVLPISLEGRDVAGQAQTGTGKTAAFLVTMFTRLLAEKDREPDAPSALIVAPTRELAFQIYEEAQIIGGHTGFSMVQVVGGVDYVKQADILKKGVDIVICTPGRIIDYYKQGVFKTKGIKMVVIDEADRLLDLGFAKDMRFILSKLPSYQKRQSMLFSATLSYRVMELTYEYMNLPEFIAVAAEEVTVEGIEQSLYHVGLENKLSLLLGLLESEDWTRALIFVNTKVGVEWLNKKLRGNKHPSEGITGDLPQPKRFKLMERFKNGDIKILIATDVASRGIHVEDISHVINYDLPQDAENYVHRIGRTARAGKTGRALSLACERYVFHLEPLEKMLGYKIPVVWPEDDWLLEDKAGPVATERKARRAKTSRDTARTRRRNRPISRKTPAETKSTYPGAFFGFGPPEEATAEKAPEKSNEKTDETAAKPKAKPKPRPKPKAKPKPKPKPKPKALQADKEDPPKKKKRRRRWKKKSPSSEKPPVEAAKE